MIERKSEPLLLIKIRNGKKVSMLIPNSKEVTEHADDSESTEWTMSQGSTVTVSIITLGLGLFLYVNLHFYKRSWMWTIMYLSVLLLIVEDYPENVKKALNSSGSKGWTIAVKEEYHTQRVIKTKTHSTGQIHC